jgi:hypothetical protein
MEPARGFRVPLRREIFMQNGNGRHEDKLDEALEDSFPASDPVSMTQPSARHGAPKRHGQTAADSLKDTVRDTARTVKREIKRRIEPDYLWLGGAFVLGCVVGLAASSAPSAFASRGYGERLMDEGSRLQRRLSRRAADLQLQRKLSRLIDRLS